MQMVRTTISLPQDTYEQLRLQAFNQKMSMGRVIAQRLQEFTDGKPSKKEIERKLARDFVLFDEIGKHLQGADLLKELREDRDRDNA